MAVLLEQISKELREYYADRGAEQSCAVQVGWKSDRAQIIRFAQLIKVIENRADHFSINDLGCGLGDFSKYLADQRLQSFRYTGYDVSDRMIKSARELYGQNKNRKFLRIDDSTEMELCDYTVASGVLNLKFTIAEDEWLRYVLETIAAMHAKSDKGFAFNALTKYSDKEFMKPELYYADPCLLFDYCKRNFSKNVALLHDYQEYDFTIIVRKN